MRQFSGEVIGTFLLVFIGCGSVAAAVLFHVLDALWQVALVWSLAVYVGILFSRRFSHSHLNPAVTIALFSTKRMNAKDVPYYLSGQFLGAFIAAVLLYILVDQLNGFDKGYDHTSAMIFGEYFPNPALKGTKQVNMMQATIAEAFGTAFLIWIIFDSSRWKFLPGYLRPVVIGLTVGLIIMVVADYTQAGLNPARDFSPRVFSYFFGWKEVAFSQGLGTIIVYVLAPVCGAVSAARIHAAMWP